MSTHGEKGLSNSKQKVTGGKRPVDLDKKFEDVAQQIEEPAKFQFTKPSKDEIKFYRNRFSFRLLCLAYVLVVVALSFFFQESLVLLALIFIVNVWIVYKVGVLAIRSLVFPFSFWVIQNSINGSSGIRYSEDFATLLEKSYILIRLT